MIINITITKEIVFQRLIFKHFLAPSALTGIEQLTSAKLLESYVTTVFKCGSEHAYILKLLRDQSMSRYIWVLYFMHLLCLRFGMLCVPGVAS